MSVETITMDQMRPKLHTVDQVRTMLATTEPLETHNFSMGDDVAFRLTSGWNHGIEAKSGSEPVDAVIAMRNGPSFTLTKDALLEATSICGIPRTYAARSPAELNEPALNYWFQRGLSDRRRDFQLLVANGVGAAVTRASIRPFSNLRLLDEALTGITDRFGDAEVLVDYKMAHSLRRTHLRLIVPEQSRTMAGTGTDDDQWSIGLQICNSLIGAEQTSIDGYLFRWACTNGAIDTQASTGTWSRRGATGSSETEVYEWAKIAVDTVLGGLEPALDAVQNMVDIPIEGHANDVLRDVFEHYKVPLPERTKIIANMVEAGGQLNMYTVMAAITQVANDSGLDPAHVENLLRLGGDLPHAAGSRCDACRRLMPH